MLVPGRGKKGYGKYQKNTLFDTNHNSDRR